MAKGEAKTTNQNIDQNRAQIQGFQSQFGNNMQTRGDDAYSRNLDERKATVGGYQSFAGGSGMTPEMEARLRGIASSGGGYSAPAYTYAGNIGEVENKYRDFMNGGGVNRYALGTLQDLSGSRGGLSDELWNPIQNSISGLAGIGNTGGYDAATRAKIEAMIGDVKKTQNLDPEMMAKFKEGLGGYSEFANTGGVSAQQGSDIMRRGTSTIPAMYNAANNQARQQSVIQGGYNPGLAASMRNNVRSQGAAGANAALNARLGLQDTINTGRQWGIGGLADASLAGAKTMNDAAYRAASDTALQTRGFEQDAISNKLTGLQGSGNLAGNLASTVSNNRLGAAQGLNQLTDIDLRASLAGTGGLENVIGNKASEAASQAAASSAAANADAARKLAIERYIIDTGNDTRLAGLGGMAGMYGTAPAETSMYYNNQLNNQQITGNQLQNNTALRAQANASKGYNWMGLLGGLGQGLLSGLGRGGLGSGNSSNNYGWNWNDDNWGTADNGQTGDGTDTIWGDGLPSEYEGG